MLTRTTAPAAYPITLDEAKAQCAVLHSDEDALIASYIAAATGYLDGFNGILGKCMITQEWALTLPAFPSVVVLPLQPVQSVVSITYLDDNEALQTLDSAEYRLFDRCIEAVNSWPSTASRSDAVTVTFSAGYGAPSDVPEPLRAVVLLMVRFLYDNRGDLPAEIPLAVKVLAAPHRAQLI